MEESAWGAEDVQYRGGPASVIKPRQDGERMLVGEQPGWEVRAWTVRAAAVGMAACRGMEQHRYII